ncbi:glycosyl hydrolase family 28-related protein [Arthrobacter sp. R4]|uniref:glycosyl hydrolase family 28-related protein n=1 Tax=Arthrobacter sp. R4 TaxID=644417 RepID=UPI003ED97D50
MVTRSNTWQDAYSTGRATLDLGDGIKVPIPIVGLVGKGDLVLNIKDHGATGNGSADDTSAFQAVANIGGIIYVPAGTYVINSVTLTKDATFICQPGVTFKRKNAVAVASAGWAGAGMFEVASAGLTVQFSDFAYDGNSANQTTVEPGGVFLKVAPPAAVTSSPTTIHLSRGKFANGTLGYVLLRGDDVQRRYETIAHINDCHFTDTVYGKGASDPGTPSALGYAPTYVMVMDYVRLRTHNFRAEWNSTTATGQYAACALNGTYWGGVYANSGESFIYMHGTTSIRGLGRALKKFDNDALFTNNAIGAIDMYGNADTLFIESLNAKDCQFVPVRAKGSLKSYTIQTASLTNNWRGLQVGPSSTGACETVVKVGSVVINGGSMPQIEFLGTSTTDRLKSVTIDAAHISGTQTNPEGLAIMGTIRARNVIRFSGRSLSVSGAPVHGIETLDVQFVYLNGISVDGLSTSTSGIYNSGGDLYQLEGFNVTATLGAGINVTTNPKKVVIRDGRVSSATDYGVFCNTTTSELLVQSVDVDTVSGLNRAFYGAGGNVSFIGNKSNATTHLLVGAGTRKRERDNSWNAAEATGTAAPTSGTYSVGDKVYATAPIAGGTIGWVCTTAGTPGTWKTFGAIAA